MPASLHVIASFLAHDPGRWKLAQGPDRAPGGRPELLPLAPLIDALVVDLRRLERDRPRPDRHLPLTGPTVADYQPMPIVIGLAGVALDWRRERPRGRARGRRRR
jgi:hypothetical protein